MKMRLVVTMPRYRSNLAAFCYCVVAFLIPTARCAYRLADVPAHVLAQDDACLSATSEESSCSVSLIQQWAESRISTEHLNSALLMDDACLGKDGENDPSCSMSLVERKKVVVHKVRAGDVQASEKVSVALGGGALPLDDGSGQQLTLEAKLDKPDQVILMVCRNRACSKAKGKKVNDTFTAGKLTLHLLNVGPHAVDLKVASK
eukprot:TRINITY_DN15245_c0_g8_i1.p1 TRINITY_DN15245_c0_g8~~TRINITY_DN15245_c0_g8_i1.p1  ORF type:complete len:204 (+),score=41.67 TRINITY_DN15245_c0_g8_i1:52-663(+)